MGEVKIKLPLAATVFVCITALLFYTNGNRFFFTLDEGIILDAAVRMLNGDVLYRDFCGYMTPGSYWIQEAVFALFGVSIRSGRIVVIGSVMGLHASQGNAAYAASKAALLSYVRTLAIESAKRSVTVNFIAPGFVDTAMLEPYAAYRPGIEARIPSGRFARPEEIAAVAAFLASPVAGYITGAYIPVDGGLTASLGIHRG